MSNTNTFHPWKYFFMIFYCNKCQLDGEFVQSIMWTKNTTTKEFSMCTKMEINKNKP